MKGRNIKVHGHALKPKDPSNPLKWVCSCGAWGIAIDDKRDYNPTQFRRDEHDNHKIAVLKSRCKWEEDND